MRNIVAGLFLLAACSIATVELPRSEKDLIKDNSVCVYKVEVNTLLKGTFSGSCTAYRLDAVDPGYKLYLVTAKHAIQEANLYQPGYVCYNKNGRYNDYANPDDITKIGFSVEFMSPSLDIAIISINILNKVSIVSIDLSEITQYAQIYTLGFAGGDGLYFSEGKTSYFQESGSLWITNAPVTFGCSGGGVFDKKTNKLIGVICELGVIRISDVASGISMPQFIWTIHKFIPVNTLREKL